jgi:hypothetical protein
MGLKRLLVWRGSTLDDVITHCGVCEERESDPHGCCEMCECCSLCCECGTFEVERHGEMPMGWCENDC